MRHVKYESIGEVHSKSFSWKLLVWKRLVIIVKRFPFYQFLRSPLPRGSKKTLKSFTSKKRDPIPVFRNAKKEGGPVPHAVKQINAKDLFLGNMGRDIFLRGSRRRGEGVGWPALHSLLPLTPQWRLNWPCKRSILRKVCLALRGASKKGTRISVVFSRIGFLHLSRTNFLI